MIININQYWILTGVERANINNGDNRNRNSVYYTRDCHFFCLNETIQVVKTNNKKTRPPCL